MGTGAKLNKPCWCGSGKKYKRCHLNRANEDPVRPQEIIEAKREAFGKKYCLHPKANEGECKGDIVKAHTIQRNGGLSRIARKGQVYSFLQNAFPKNGDFENIEAKPRGVGLASTFTGFCGFHDNIVFEPIEKYPFQSIPQHAFLLGYRAVCKELFLKRAAMEMSPFRRTLDRGKDIDEQIGLQELMRFYDEGAALGLKEIEFHKAAFDEALLRSDYSMVNLYIIRLDRVPDVMCSGATQPEYDFDGNQIQDWYDREAELDWFTYSLIATDTGGAAVFSWMGDQPACLRFIKSLDSLRDDQISHALVRFTFEYFENSYFSPDWYEGLDAKSQRKLLVRQLTEATPSYPRSPDCLKDDGLRIVSWVVQARETNLDLQS